MDMQDIVTALREQRVQITKHAIKEAENDGLDLRNVVHSVPLGNIIHHYPEDKPYPSCLVLSWVNPATPLHSVWAYNAETRWAVLITVYRPDPNRWIDCSTRVKS